MADEVGAKLDGRVELTCEGSGLSATVTLHAPQNGGADVTIDMINDTIKRAGITTGILFDNIKRMAEDRIYEVPTCVAMAIEPKKGANGYINYRYDKEHKLKPQQDEFGIADFRELNAIVPIQKNDVIADIVPPTEGVPGKNIFGKELPAQPGTQPKISLGRNTLLTLDGLKILSACDGHIMFGGGTFHVEEGVTVKADLDLSVGNINFLGNVHIKGNIMEGFTINAGKDVKIDGSVFGGEIVAGGNVTIVGGCINGKVTCDGNADIGFCENAEIFSKGDVVSKQFAFCNVFCYGALSTKSNRGVICGGKVTSMHDVTAAIIGSSKYTPTEVYVGDGSVLFMRRREAEADLNESIRIFDMAIKNLAFLKQRKQAQGGMLTEAQQKQFRIETQNKLFHAMRKTQIQETINQLDEDIKNKDNLSAICTGTIYPGAKFVINFLTLEVSEAAARSRVTIVDDKLEVVPL
ncbi:MAG: DUF342 domain-containing protein [Oscillospiraceae bacterium]